MTPFARMNGLGNTFLVVDARAGGVRPDPDVLRRLAQAGTGPGFDQFITIEESARADAFMRIDNADGGEVEACGNAARCVAHLLMDRRESATIETRADLLSARPGAEPMTVMVDMGRPRVAWNEIPIAEDVDDTRAVTVEGIDLGPASLANIGNPHAIFWAGDVEAHDLAMLGPEIEHHPLFPERVNASLAHVTATDAIRLRTWERGVGLTHACGTAACAALVCAARTERTGRRATVSLPGGDLSIEWGDDDRIRMTGPVEHEYRGLFDPETGAWQRSESVA